MIIFSRNRRLRTNESIRSLVRETVLTTNDFVMPMFVMEGENAQEAIPSMPGIFRRTVDLTVKECKELFADLEGSLRPWLGRSSEDRHTKDVVNFKEQWKAMMGFDPDDLEAKAKWEKEIVEVSAAVTNRVVASQKEAAAQESSFYTKVENIRLKRLRQQGRIK